jgi:uncharacterized protein
MPKRNRGAERTGRRAPLRSPRAVATVSAIVLGLALLAPAAGATEYPTLQYWVTDQMGVLTESEVSEIEDNCIEVYNAKGAEMAVLIVNTTLPDGIDIFAVKTFEKNKLGQAGRDDGLLIVISVSEGTWRIEVGYGLEGVLPDSLVGSIADEQLVPFLNQSDYYQGLLYTTAFLGQEILDHYDGKPPKQGEENNYPISWLPCTTWQLVLVVLFLALAVGTTGRILWWLPSLLMGRRGGGGGGGRSWGGGRSGGGGASGKW